MNPSCRPGTRSMWLRFVSAGVLLALSVRLVGVPKADAAAAAPRTILEASAIPKYVDPLPIPKAMPAVGRLRVLGCDASAYEVAARQFPQQMLPTQGWGAGGLKPFPKTTVWGYGPARDSGNSRFASPAMTFEVRRDEKVLVRWVNGLVDGRGRFLPPLLPVDQTLHWADPAGTSMTAPTATPYTGPVPLVVHLHGAHVADNSDGYPEAWMLPNASNLPAEYMRRGPNYTSVLPAPAGSAWYLYTNDQLATTLWYHDHAMGITRCNVYAGLTGFYLIRDGAEKALNLPGPAPKAGDCAGKDYYEIPLAVQDKTFYNDGSLFFPADRAYFEGLTPDQFHIPTAPRKVDGATSDVAPIWNPEFFGNTIVVNGKAWPYLNVEPRRYRFRLLNACNARTMVFKIEDGRPFHVIGSDGGLLSGAPAAVNELLLMPAERADVIVDFTGLKPGQRIKLLNLGPDEPFHGPHAAELPPPADPDATGQVMQFRVVRLKKADTSADPQTLVLPTIQPLGAEKVTRDLTLNEASSSVVNVDGGPLQPGEDPFGPTAAFLGTGADGPLKFMDPITEKPVVGDTEIWRIINLTEDAHPIHLHLVQFQVLDRTPFNAEAYGAAQADFLAGNRAQPDPLAEEFWPTPGMAPAPEPPSAQEAGWKDTTASWPGYVTRLKAKFDMKGLYLWHCHILDHEDNEMMRPYEVVAP